MPWSVYIVQCADESFYCGMSTDVFRRVREHNGQKKGARYTRTRRPVMLRAFRSFASRAEAAQEEWRIKRMSRAEKKLWVAEHRDL